MSFREKYDMNFEKIAIKSLSKIKTILDENNIEFWLDYGTLLGAIRERKIISWDTDIDLGMWRRDVEKLFSSKNEFEKQGLTILLNNTEVSFHDLEADVYIGGIFTYQLIDGRAICPRMINPYKYYKRKGEIHARSFSRILTMFATYSTWLLTEEDIHCNSSQFKLKKLISFIPFKSQIDYVIKSIFSKMFGYIYFKELIPKAQFENLKTIKFYNMKFKIPKKTEDYLLYRYGENWITPERDYMLHRHKKIAGKIYL